MGFASAEPVTGKRALSIDMHLYRHQLEAAVSFAIEQEWDQVYGVLTHQNNVQIPLWKFQSLHPRLSAFIDRTRITLSLAWVPREIR